MRSQTARIGLLTLAVALGCRSQGDTVLYVEVYWSDQAPVNQTRLLEVTVKTESGREGSAQFRSRNQDGSDSVLRFPTSFSIELPSSVAGPVRLEVVAYDGAGGVLARFVDDRLELQVGKQKRIAITLGCGNAGCGGDGGAPDGSPIGPALGDASSSPDAGDGRCGNGSVDDGELCDPGIPAGRPGACPPASCDDGLRCTRDFPVGAGCTLSCRYEEITRVEAGDGCCPARSTAATDPDCSTTCGNGSLEPGETCDPGLDPADPNACPSAESCDDQDPCSADGLISAGTCAAVCISRPIVTAVPGDGCCPLGAASTNDGDCPVVCGNGRFERAGGETCDRGLPPSHERRCPEACPDDGDPCTKDALVGSGCQTECRHTRIEESIGGDGCCLPGVGRALDPDCPARCGNGLVEPGEYCDKAIAAGSPGACPSACSIPGPALCLTARLEGSADSCTARCAQDLTLLCSRSADGCCPQGCGENDPDPDCSATCGNGTVDPGESCDLAIMSGAPGACPAPGTCSDANACTTDRLVSPGTCSARCVSSPITIFDSDGCCPSGGNALVDVDCPAVCGNGIAEDQARETCDRGIPAGAPGSCAAGCPAPPPACIRATPSGNAETCTARCTFAAITTCQGGDGCCPPECTQAGDDDCSSVCGNGLVETGETCDWGIPAGNAGACIFLCDDNDACTRDGTLGRTADCTRTCRHAPIRACLSGDGCCPGGCNPENDQDCKPRACGNRAIEAGETCDPPSACPTRCVDDGDPCTVGRLLGDAQACSATCVHTPISVCSGTTADRCCPRGCLPGSDVDCGAPPVRPAPL